MRTLNVDGGASANDFLMQITGRYASMQPVNRPSLRRDYGHGCSLSGRTCSWITGTSKEDVLKNWAIDKTFTPQIMDAERGKRIKGWEKAVKYAYGWARDEED